MKARERGRSLGLFMKLYCVHVLQRRYEHVLHSSLMGTDLLSVMFILFIRNTKHSGVGCRCHLDLYNIQIFHRYKILQQTTKTSPSLTLVNFQLDAQNSYLFTYNTFIKILYMF